VRELHEELGIEADRYTPWITREFVYPHAHVRLHFFRVSGWHGEIRDIHHDALAWKRAGNVDVEPMLPANVAVLRGLTLPDFYAITHAGEIGIEAQLQLLERALAGGLRLLQIREPGSIRWKSARRFAREATRLAHAHGARVLVNGDLALARHVGADGVHLPCAQLMQLASGPTCRWWRLPAITRRNWRAPPRWNWISPCWGRCGDAEPSRRRRPRLGALRAAAGKCFAAGVRPRRPAARRSGSAQQAGAHGIAAIRAAWET
jgi:8-oxo-dGTP diphosphatase